jgi:hypothetical protein
MAYGDPRKRERNNKGSHILKGRTYISVQKIVHFKSFYEFYHIYNDKNVVKMISCDLFEGLQNL